MKRRFMLDLSSELLWSHINFADEYYLLFSWILEGHFGQVIKIKDVSFDAGGIMILTATV